MKGRLFAWSVTLLVACLAADAGRATDGVPPADAPSETRPEQGALQQGNEWHRVTAAVLSTDPEEGMVTLESDPSPLRLAFDPASVRDLKRGDVITVQMAFVKNDATTGNRAYDAPLLQPVEPAGVAPAPPEGAIGRRTLTGTVRDVDRTTGVLSFQSGGKVLKLQFPTTALQDLEEGDQITIHLAFSKDVDLTGSASHS